MLPSREMAIRLPVFEGPLDLLLFLIRKNELDIYDIPIEEVTHQYMGVLREMDELNLEVAGEFFVMAATLMYIKSRMLLPVNDQEAQPEEEAEEADPRWELVEQLLEYKRFKDAAEQIRQLVEQQQDFLPRLFSAKEEEVAPRPVKNSDRIELWNVFNLVLRRLAEKIVQGEIRDEQVTVSDRMEYILNKLSDTPEFLFTELFEPGQKITVPLIVASLLAVLELTRLKKLTVEQEELFGDIRCFARPEEDEPPPLPDEEDEPDTASVSTGAAAVSAAVESADEGDEYEEDDDGEPWDKDAFAADLPEAETPEASESLSESADVETDAGADEFGDGEDPFEADEALDDDDAHAGDEGENPRR
ncbi:segregation/condensation protein A [Ruficoccus amylovorans]|uniref:Segregation and condensation protein A n=1 Tax=Ruficoccus amylovorans TaxID=1804625 RepID=A0A842HC59_9BACT|nr:segregation/condensation protein A [Ruficoccus amylovorans]